MKPVLWTKTFHFSASFSKGTEVRGHNFTLAVTAEYAAGMDEAAVEKKNPTTRFARLTTGRSPGDRKNKWWGLRLL